MFLSFVWILISFSSLYFNLTAKKKKKFKLIWRHMNSRKKWLAIIALVCQESKPGSQIERVDCINASGWSVYWLSYQSRLNDSLYSLYNTMKTFFIFTSYEHGYFVSDKSDWRSQSGILYVRDFSRNARRIDYTFQANINGYHYRISIKRYQYKSS